MVPISFNAFLNYAAVLFNAFLIILQFVMNLQLHDGSRCIFTYTAVFIEFLFFLIARCIFSNAALADVFFHYTAVV